MNDLNPSRKPAMWTRPGGLLALFLLAGLLALATPLRADDPPTYLFQWGSQGSGNSQFQESDGIAVDSSNNVYVADTYNNRIEKFDRDGNYLTQWGSQGSGNGQFDYPEGIAIDGSNNVYVADTQNYRVEKFDGNGNYLTKWGSKGSGNGQFYEPYGIAVDSSNDVYVADTSNDRIEKFTSNGSYLTQWGSSGSGNGQFYVPIGIAVDRSNNIYVADTDNYRVEKFTSNGSYLTQWGSSGNGNGQFEYPQGIAIDSSNIVYVVDLGNECVEKFDQNGNYLTQWGSLGSGYGQFDQPYGIVLDDSGNFIYVTDAGNDLVQVFANSTTLLPPYITSQPASQNVVAGFNASFSVTAVGGTPLAYQWTSNTIALFNATNSTLTLTNISLAAVATYAVLVTNSFGNVTSSNIVLTVVPAFVITSPVTGISAAGAVLNGSVTVGEDTAVWFNWGTDTNYGNITAMTIVPGDSGTTNLSATLNGLSTNIYHYQIVATNISGIVYGNDQSFVVADLAPTVTTLSPAGATNGVILNATVNPNGLDTTVYFNWGPTGGSLSNSTPLTDVGAGTAPLNVNSLITSLVPFEQYDYQVVASNSLGTVSGALVAFYSPPFASTPIGIYENTLWEAAASSADGTKIVAGRSLEGSSGIYTSTDSGVVWTLASSLAAQGVASSADGTKLTAVVDDGYIYISTNSGTTWVQASNAPYAGWVSIASSADGTRLAAVAYNFSGVYTSSNSGVNWSFQTNGLLSNLGWSYIASSANGSKLVAASGLDGAGPIFTSTNSGVNWTRAINAPLASWYSVASSADGNKMLACSYPGNVYISTNAGVNWTKTSLPTNNWNCVAESADGTKAVALANSGSATFGTGSGGIFTSTNSGTTWVSNDMPSASWTCAAMSADGNEFIAAMGYPSTIGGIYVSQTTPSPILNVSASDNDTSISWIIPSLDFTLQQSPDLLNWADVTNEPVLNLTNLQNQVVLPPPAGNNFFRLMH